MLKLKPKTVIFLIIYIMLNVTIMNLFKSHIPFILTRSISIFLFFVLLPYCVFFFIKRKKYAAILLLAIFFFPIPGRFLMTKQMLIRKEANNLFRAASMIEHYYLKHQRLPYDWKDIKGNIPVSVFNFGHYEYNYTPGDDFMILSPVFRMNSKETFIYYDSGTKTIEYGTEKDN